MKKFVLSVIALASVVQFSAISTSSARPGEGGRHGYRYSTSYGEWDRTVTSYYGYSETRCEYTSTSRWTTSTCYSYQPTDIVYVEERDLGERNQVTIYTDSSYNTPYVTYYTYDNGPRHYVAYREFHPAYTYYRVDPYYTTTYYTTYYVATDWTPAEVDFYNGWNEIFTGMEVGLIGADVLANSGGDGGAAVVGVALIVAGIASSNSGQEDLDKSRLEMTIEADAKAQKADVK